MLPSVVKTQKSALLGARKTSKLPSLEPKHTEVPCWEPKPVLECLLVSQKTCLSALLVGITHFTVPLAGQNLINSLPGQNCTLYVPFIFSFRPCSLKSLCTPLQHIAQEKIITLDFQTLMQLLLRLVLCLITNLSLQQAPTLQTAEFKSRALKLSPICYLMVTSPLFLHVFRLLCHLKGYRSAAKLVFLRYSCNVGEISQLSSGAF